MMRNQRRKGRKDKIIHREYSGVNSQETVIDATALEFWLNDEQCVIVSIEHGKLHLHGAGPGFAHRLSITAESSNSIDVEMVP